jgi:eukaryotic-like serine/threonine-protein kinase
MSLALDSFSSSDILDLLSLGMPARTPPALDLPDPLGPIQSVTFETRVSTPSLPGPQMPFPNTLLDRFLPVRVLGVGGMGAVFLARDMKLARLVAVKVMQQQDDPVHRQRFLREAAGLARLEHRNLPVIYDFGETEEGPYMVLEYLSGTPLHQIPLPFDPLPAMLQVADALEEIHRRGYLHRDVKPANIILTEEGRAVLVDLGLLLHPDHSPLTRTGKVVGTMNFMAPEVLTYQTPGPRSDWYSWGVTLYALLERDYPFDVKCLVRAAKQGYPLRPPFERIDPRTPLAFLLRRVLSLDPSHRPSSRAEIEAMLAQGEEGEATHTDLETHPSSYPPNVFPVIDTSAASEAVPISNRSVVQEPPRISRPLRSLSSVSEDARDPFERALSTVGRVLERLIGFLGLDRLEP